MEERHRRVKTAKGVNSICGAMMGQREIRLKMSSANAFEIYLKNQGTLNAK